MGLKQLLVISVAVLLVCAGVIRAAGPREPLTFKNVGLYGGWNDVFVSESSPFDFLIVQAHVASDGRIGWHGRWEGPAKGEATWNEWLQRARASGKRVIADLGATLADGKGEEQAFAGLWNVKEPLPVEQFFPRFDEFFKQVDEDQLYAITIGEEAVFWNGHDERLKAAYDYLKKKYDVPFYQWYSPSQSGAGSRPGLSWPNLPADGWMLDEYFLEQPAIEIAMRNHRLLQKPVFQIIWAAPDCKSATWSERMFWDQYTACRKYDVPVAFFCWSAREAGAYSDKWGWEPSASPEMRRVFEDFCVYSANLAKRLPPVPPSEWDYVAASLTPIPLKVQDDRKGHATYEETFAKERGLALLSDATIAGFANLRWDSSALELKPRTSGKAESTLRYCFESPARPKRITASIAGKAPAGDVELILADRHEKVLAQSAMAGASSAAQVESGQHGDTRFLVICRMKGEASKAGEVLAALDSISIEVELETPSAN